MVKLEIKLNTTMRALLWLGILGIFNSQTCSHWASSNSQVQFRFSYLAMVPTQVSASESLLWQVMTFLYLLVGLSNLGNSGVSFVLFFLGNPKRAVHFPFISFTCYEIRVAISKSITYGTRNWKFPSMKF